MRPLKYNYLQKKTVACDKAPCNERNKNKIRFN